MKKYGVEAHNITTGVKRFYSVNAQDGQRAIDKVINDVKNRFEKKAAWFPNYELNKVIIPLRQVLLISHK